MRIVGLARRLSVVLVLMLVAFVALAAPTTPVAAFDVESVATSAVTNITALVSDWLPLFIATVGFFIVLRIARRLFR